MPASFLQFYVGANVLIALAIALLLSVRTISARLWQPISFRHQLHFGYALVAAAILAPCLAAPSMHGDFLPKTTQVWSAPSMKTTGEREAGAPGATISLGASAATVSLDGLTQASMGLCLAGFLIALVRVLRSADSTRRGLGRAQLIRRSGALRILSTDEADIPFSFWLPGRCYIVVPSVLIVRPTDLRVALRHETQHHRNGDTRLLYAIELLKGAFLLNPAVHRLCRHLRELQEFACDEALSRDVSARAYSDCLLWVAQGARRTGHPGSCMQMADTNRANILARRIEAILARPKQHLRRSAVIAMNAAAVLIIVATGIVLPGTVQDRRVSMSQAREMAARMQAESSFPIVINERVVEELNRLLATPDGRAFVRESLQRMSAHQELITARLAQYGLPSELLAVPIVESGYRNLPQGANPAYGAGIWMFIKPTARKFALAVDGAADERLNVSLETDAAMKMLAHLHWEFNDWSLALLAYNGGQELVQRGVRETGSRDAFQLVRQGYENDAGYVPRMMAAIIVVKNARDL
jgi:beta-lactamase regulating signal transducer with metallopeptidase domain